MLPAHGLANKSDTSQLTWSFFDCEIKDFDKGRFMWAFCAFVCFTIGFPASVTILFEMIQIWKRGTPITPINFFILNLSIMDTLFLLFIPPGLLNNLILKSWDFEAFWTGIYALNQSGRPFLMVCVCLDCYFAVVHPIAYHKRKSLTPRIAMAGIVWILTVTTGSLYVFCINIYDTIIPYVPFIMSTVIIGICDSLILSKLIRSQDRVNIHPQKQRSIQVLIQSLVMTVISYLPPIIMFVVVKTVKTHDKAFQCTILIQTSITSTLGSAVMPILYLNQIGKLDHFRFAFCRRS